MSVGISGEHAATFHDIPSGTRFGHWTIVEWAGWVSPTNKHATFSCVCDCGAEKIVTGVSLRNGTSTQCRDCCAKNWHHRVGRMNIGRRAQCEALRAKRAKRKRDGKH
jgi:hypothetical protein